MHVHPQYIHHLHNSTTLSPLKMGEKIKTTFIVSLSGGRRTLIEHLIGEISTVAVSSDDAKSIKSSST